MIISGERHEFMIHAYHALLTGSIFAMGDEVHSSMVKAVAEDLCTAARALPKDQQLLFIDYIRDRMERPN